MANMGAGVCANCAFEASKAAAAAGLVKIATPCVVVGLVAVASQA